MVVTIEDTGNLDSLSYYEVPVEILDRQVLHLRPNDIASAIVFWRNHKVEKSTWEAEEVMKSIY